MADGRILSKRISRSVKIAKLSSDTARMIYSWLIPYLDVEGRMEADPKLLKADIAPLLEHITPKLIQNILIELHKINLICLYIIDNKQYLQLTKFNENQKNLRKDRESASSIPAAPPAELQQDSGTTPAQLRHNSAISLSLRSRLNKTHNARARTRGEDPPYEDIIKYLNQKTGKNFDHLSKETRSKIKARWGVGKKQRTLDDFKKVIDIKCLQWLNNPELEKYLRPETLFGTKFESYLNEKATTNTHGYPTYPQDVYVNCPRCKREVLKEDLDGAGCIKCAEKPAYISNLLGSIGEKIPTRSPCRYLFQSDKKQKMLDEFTNHLLGNE